MKAYIGIDLGKKSVAAFCRHDQRDASRATFVFHNSLDSFQRLLNWIERQGISEPIFVMEASGSCWMVPYAWLTARGHRVAVLQPALIRYFAKSLGKRTKNDRVDARSIAEYAAREGFEGESGQRLDKLEQRTAARDLSRLVEDAAAAKNRLQSHIALVFPELAEVFSDLCCRSVCALLEAYPDPAAMVAAGLDKLADVSINGQRRLGHKRAARILERAQKSVGLKIEGDYFAFRLGQLLTSLRQLLAEQAEIESWIEQHLPVNDLELLSSHTGCGKALAAVVMTEVEDPERFSRADKIVAYAGINPREVETGKADQNGNSEKSWRMSKQGNRRLRRAIYLIALNAVRHDPKYKAYYEAKRAKGKKPKVALGHCMRKVLVTLWTMWRKNEFYNVNKVVVAPQA